MAMIWAGIDAGKTHHHCVVIDERGERLLSRRVANDEPELLELLADVSALEETVTWGIDLADGGAAPAITLLFNHGQPVHYISGRAIHRTSESYRGEGKTDAKDAAVIADQVRIRRDLHPLRTSDETVTDLKILTGRAHRPGRRPNPHRQPAPHPAHRYFPWSGAGAGPDQRRSARAAESSSRGESHPSALPERSVTTSRHSALVILITRPMRRALCPASARTSADTAGRSPGTSRWPSATAPAVDTSCGSSAPSRR